jgi:peroxiredoxin
MKTLLSLIIAGSVLINAHAESTVGKPAPDFTLKDTSGKEHKLADLKGKYVVLEWVNYGCPFVKKHYDSNNMQALQKDAADKGVVWLSICSSAPGKQGHFPPAEAAEKTKAYGAASAGYLIDEDGTVGKLYGAKTTPDMFVINPEGVLIYKGAIDDNNSPDAAVIKDSKNYVMAALTEALAGQPVSTSSTKPYGCGVKYP